MAYAVITGASSGLGREFAHLFAAEGTDVVLVARRAQRLTALAEELRAQYRIDARVVVADLREPDACDRIMSATSGLPVEFLVNNAGFGWIGTFNTAGGDPDLDMVRVNVVAATRLTKLFLAVMLKRGRGRILNVSSVGAFLPGPFAAVYYATKAYLLSFSEALSEELSGTPITVTTLCPGRTETEFMAVAGVPDAPFLSRPVPSRWVAAKGYAAMKAGKRVVVPGFANKALVWLIRLCPRRILTRVTRLVQQRG